MCLPGYLAHKKQRPPRTLQWEYAYCPMVVPGGEAVSYGRGTPVGLTVENLRNRVQGPGFDRLQTSVLISMHLVQGLGLTFWCKIVVLGFQI